MPVKKHGNFEQYIDQKMNRIYAEAGKARIDKVPTPTFGANGSLKYGKKSTVDFVGVVEGGRMIAFDCKETIKDILPMSMIHDHQVTYLTKVAAYGGIAFLLVRIGRPARYFVQPVSQKWLKTHWEMRWGMTVADLERLGSEVSDVCDYLEPAMEAVRWECEK